MSQTITIESYNYVGESATIIFNPQETELVLNLGNHILPFIFNPSLLIPPQEIYGYYTITTLYNNCTYYLNVPKSTPTPTPTNTPTKTQTPTPTSTPTPTPTFDPCKVPTPTPTPTSTTTPTPTITPTPSATCTNPCGCKPPKPTPSPTRTPKPPPTCTNPCGCTPTPTPTNTPTNTSTPTLTPTNTSTPTSTPTPTPTQTPSYLAYLFIEPVSGSSSIGQWMVDGGSNFFGFSNTSQPTQNQPVFDFDMNRYVDFSGWTSGEFPTVITQTVPQTNGGTDSFGNSIVAYNFLTTEIQENSVGGDAWYTWIIPLSSTNNETQVLIDINTSNNPNLLTGVATEGTINSYTFNYTGSTIPNTIYKVYTTFPNIIFQINDSQNIYFRGNATSP